MLVSLYSQKAIRFACLLFVFMFEFTFNFFFILPLHLHGYQISCAFMVRIAFIFSIIKTFLRFECFQSPFECFQPPRTLPQLIVTKISRYTIYLYVFITVRTAPQLNRFSYTAQSVDTIQNFRRLFLGGGYFFSSLGGGLFAKIYIIM